MNGNLIQFTSNGGWCWFQDERVIVDAANGKMLVSALANENGVGGSSKDGDVDVSVFDLATRTSRVVTLKHSLTSYGAGDDHNAAALLVRPSGGYLAVYAGHNNNDYSYYRSTSSPEGEWGPEGSFDWDDMPGGTDFPTSYSNLFYLSDEGRTYNFARSDNRSPNFMISMDEGNNWDYGGQLTRPDGDIGYVNGYFKYISNGVDRIDFLATEHHPRDYNTSIYHGYVKGGKSYNSSGGVEDSDIFDKSAPRPADFTRIFRAGTNMAGVEMTKCWNIDIQNYSDGTLATVFKCRANNSESDHRFLYGRFSDGDWDIDYVAKAGYKLFSSEQDYTGLAAMDPNDPFTIYISTPINPSTNAEMDNHEIFKGVSGDQGASWTWTALTSNSTCDNYRPVVPVWSSDTTALVWFRGNMSSSQDYDGAMVGLLMPDGPEGLKSYRDATLDNTLLADGGVFVPSGPSDEEGPSDDNWHQRTGHGNGGAVFTSAESGSEDAPVLRTDVPVSASGLYDVWVYFWANPDEDWRIESGLDMDNMQIFQSMACRQVGEGEHEGTVVLNDGGNRYLYQAYLGRVTVDASHVLRVYVDDEERTWYDGVAIREFAQLPMYTLTTSVTGQGSITPAEGSYLEGSAVELTAASPTGWAFDGWSGDAVGTANPLTITMDADKSVSANFIEVPTHTLTSSVTGQGAVNPGSGEFNQGSTVTLTALPAPGWVFDSWSGDAGGSTNPVSILMDFNKSVTANFIESPLPPALIRLEFNENSGSSVGNAGTVSATFTKTAPPVWSTNVPVNGGASSVDFGTGIGNYYVESESIISELTGLTGFTVTGWVNNRSSDMGSGGNRIVSWIRNGGNGVDIVYKSDGAIQVGINQWPDGSVALSSSGKIPTDAAAPESNWRFFAVTYESSSGNVQFYFGDNTIPASLDKTISYDRGAVGSDISKLAVGHFNEESSRTSRTNRMFRGLIDQVEVYGTVLSLAEIQIAQNIAPPVTYELTTSAIGQGTVSPGSGTYVEGTSVELTATPAAGWQFDGWGGDVTGTTNPITIIMDSDKSVTATFNQIPTYNLTTSVIGQGTVSPVSGTFEEGSSVELTATPALGWTFDGWSGDAGGTDNPITVIMDADKSVSATFSEIPTYDLTTSVNGQGSVSPNSGTFNEGSSVELTATPASGWAFDGWSGDAVGMDNPVTVIMDANKSVTAYFIEIPTYDLTTSVIGQGSINPGSGTYEEGSEVELTATPATGWVFDGWSGDASGSVNPVNIVMDNNKSITATFIESPLPPALVRLGFNENGGSSVGNAGTVLATFTKTTPPDWSANVPVNGGASSVDFGTSIGNYYVESESIIGELAGLTGFTVTGWVNNRSSAMGSGGNRIVSWIRNGGNGVDIVYKSDGALQVGINQWPDRSIALSSSSQIPTDASAPESNWRFFAVTYESSTGSLSFYFGDNTTPASLDKTISYDQGAVRTDIGKLAVGHFNAESSRTSRTNRMFRGLIDHVEIYSTVLSLIEIQTAQNLSPAVTYELITSVIGQGTVAPSSGTYEEGSSVELTATPDAGWVFDGWSGDAVGMDNPVTINMDSDKSVTAYFILIPTYDLTTSVIGQGTVSPSSGTYEEGSSVELTATPETGWRFDGWSGDVTGTTNPVTITMDSDKSIAATFSEVPTYDLTTSVTGQGSINPSSGTYNEGSSVELTATPAGGWQFDGWSGDVSGTSNPITLIMDSDKSVTATFSEVTYNLSTSVTGQGSISPNSGTYSEGTSVELTAAPAAGWQFAGWSGDVSGTSNPITLIMDSDKSVTATFSEVTYNLSTSVTGQGSISPSSGTYPEGATVELTATPDAGWQFDGWSGDASGLTNPITITMDSDKSVTASFSQITYTLNTSVIGQGSVSPSSGTYAEGSSVELTATPPTGWAFDSWSGDASSTNNPITIIMDSDKSITATFVEIPTYELSTTVIGQGSVNPSSGTYEEGSSVELTAAPASGWVFDSWSGDASGSTNPLTITMDADKTITATFIESPLPPALVRLGFNENSGSSVGNTGTVSATFTKTTPPDWSANVPVNGGASSVDFGTSTGNYYVESESIISELTGLTGFSVTGWVNNRSSAMGSGGNRIVSWIKNGGNGVDIVYKSDGALQVGINQWPDRSIALSSPGKIPTDAAASESNWQFFAVTYESSSGDLKFYFGDNTTPAGLDKTINYDQGAVGSDIGKLAIGHFNAESKRTSRTNRVFRGLIDQIEIYGSVLSLAEIQTAQNLVPPVTYTLTTSVTGQGTISPRSGTYVEGTSVELTATPALGWAFDGWSGDATGTNNPVTIVMDTDKSVTATFSEIPTYNLTTSVIGQGSASPSSGTYEEGSSVELTATPASGWAFDSWSGDVTGTMNPVTIVMDDDKSVTATFSEVPTYELRTSVTGQGSVSPGSGTYNEGISVELTAIPATGWAFDGWSGDLNGTNNPVMLIMNEDKSVTASFSEIPTYNLTTSVIGQGSVSPSSGTYEEGSSVELTAAPASGWVFDSWSGDASGSTNPFNVIMDADRSVTATFVESPLPPALIWLEFNEGSGSSVGNTGTASATFTKTAPPDWSANVPVNGGASSVDFGTSIGNYYVESESIISQLAGLTGFTVTGWVNNRSSAMGSGGNRIVSWIRNGGNGVDIVYKSDGALQVGINQWPDRSIALSSSGQIPTDVVAPESNWRFFAVTYESSSGSVNFYFGDNANPASLDKTIGYDRGAVGSDIGKLAVGHFNEESSRTSRTNRMFRGLVDKIGIFGEVLSLQEIQSAQNLVIGEGPFPVTGVSVSPTTTSVFVDATIQLTETVSPPWATDKSVSWSSNNSFVATVSATGLVTGIAEGSATITVTTGDGGYTASCDVTVMDAGGAIYQATEHDEAVVLTTGALQLEVKKSAFQLAVSDLNGNVLTAQAVAMDKAGAVLSHASAGTAPVVKRNPPRYHAEAEATITGESHRFDCSGATVTVTFRNPWVFSVFMHAPGSSGATVETFTSTSDEHFWGLGETWDVHSLDMKGHELTMANRSGTPDQGGYIPFYISSRGYGILIDNHLSVNFDFDASSTTINIPAIDGSTDGDGYVNGASTNWYFYYGPGMLDVIDRYTEHVSRPALPPPWSVFSTWQWRDDNNESGARSDVTAMQEAGIPLSLIWLDRPWATGDQGMPPPFEWNSSYPNGAQMTTNFNAMGVKVGVWVAENGYVGAYNPDSWMNESHVNQLKGDITPWLAESNVQMYKIDRGNLQNFAPYFTTQAFYEAWYSVYEDDFVTLPRVVSHYGQKYISGKWPGDNDNTFGYDRGGLAANIPAMLNLGITGFPHWGSDTGGFPDVPGNDVTIRWAQFSSMCTIFQTCSRPYAFGETHKAIYKKYAMLYTSLFPYRWTYTVLAHEKGYPTFRALPLHHPDDPQAYNQDAELYFGDWILAAPVVEDATSRSVYLPEGEWVDWWTGERHPGKTNITADAPLDVMPLYMKAGAIIPMIEVSDTKNQNYLNSQMNPLTMRVCPKGNTGFSMAGDKRVYNKQTQPYTNLDPAEFTSQEAANGVVITADGAATSQYQFEVYTDKVFVSVKHNGVLLTKAASNAALASVESGWSQETGLPAIVKLPAGAADNTVTMSIDGEDVPVSD